MDAKPIVVYFLTSIVAALPAVAQPYNANVWDNLTQVRMLIQQNQPLQALPLVQEFVRQKPLEPEGFFWQGVIYDNLGRVDQALISYAAGVHQVLRAGMDCAELRLNFANDLLKVNRIDDAIDQYRRAAQIDPGLPIVQLNLGRALVEKGDVEGALECFQRCEDLHYNPYQLSYYRAKAFVKAGRAPDARAQVLTALSKLNASSQAAVKLKQEFAAILQQP